MALAPRAGGRCGVLAPALRRLAVSALASGVLPLWAHAQDDGPRVYQLAPRDAQIFTTFAVYKRGDEGPEPGQKAPGYQQTNTIVVLRYAHTLGWADRQLTPFVILPFGAAEVRQAPPGAPAAEASSGLGDAQLGVTLGLLGAPALSRADYAQFRPDFSTSALGRVYFPTGDYSAGRPVNFGANRFAVQVGLPTTVLLGQSYLDEDLTALELLPTVTFYGTNDDPLGAAEVSQDPLFSLEAHLTRNLTRRVWASADLLYRNGGRTYTDGIDNDDPIHGWSAGGTLAFPLTRASSLAFTYEHVVERYDDGPVGWFFRTALIVPL